MAITDKDIIITPNIGSSTDDPKIQFKGGNANVATEVTLRVYPSNSGTLSFEGSAGQLFSITNDLTGSIFSVNDVSGIPSIDVNADGTVYLASFNGNIGIGTSTVSSKLAIYGGNVRVGSTGYGVIFPDGTFQTTAFNSLDGLTSFNTTLSGLTPSTASTGAVTLAGTLGVGNGGTGGTTFTSNGILYGNGTSAIQVTAQGGTNTVLVANAGAPSFSSTPLLTSLTTTGGLNAGGAAIVNSLTSNTTITAGTGLTVTSGGATITGGLTVSGNLTVAGNINVNSSNVLVTDEPIIYVGDNNPANLWDLGIVGSYTVGTYKHTGFLRNQNDGVWTIFDNLITEPTQTINWSQTGINYGTFKAGNINVAATTSSTSTTTGAIITAGGVGVAGNLNVGGVVSTFTGNVGIGTASTSDLLHVQGNLRLHSTDGKPFQIYAGNVGNTGSGFTTRLKFTTAPENATRAFYWFDSPSSLGSGFSLAGQGEEKVYFGTENLAGLGISNTVLSYLSMPMVYRFTTSNATVQSSISNNVIFTPTGRIGVNTLTPTSNLHVIGDANIFVSTTSTSTTTGAIVTAGGIGVAGNINVGGTVNTFTGNVGVGTTVIGRQLTVAGGGGNVQIGSVFSGYNGITLNTSLVDAEYNILSSSSDRTLYINRPSTKEIRFRMQNVDQMTLNSTGNLGIGSTTPVAKLDVTGDIKASGNITATNFTYTNGTQLNTPTYLDDISTQFDGLKTSFNLTASGTAVTLTNPLQLQITIGGVPIAPSRYRWDYYNLTDFGVFTKGYIINGSTVTFATAPMYNMDFFGVANGISPYATFNYIQSPFTALNIMFGA
jgi:hypothetical protein